MPYGSGLFPFFFQFDQILVLKKKKAKEREMEIYRKLYQCFCCLHLPYVCILPSLGSLLLLQSDAAIAPSFYSWPASETSALAVQLPPHPIANPLLSAGPHSSTDHQRSCLLSASLWTA